MSVNTAAAIILSSDEKQSQEDNTTVSNLGRPNIGQDFYINKDVANECGSSLSSLSGGLTNLSNIPFGDLGYDTEKAIGEDDNKSNVIHAENRPVGQFDVICREENTNTEDKSSLSSLTNDFVHRKGRLFPFGRLRSFQVELEGLSDCDDSGPSNPKKKNDTPEDCSPWYKYRGDSIRNSTQNSTAPNSPSSQGNATSTSQGITIGIPDEELFTSKKHLDELVRYLPPPSAFFHNSSSLRRVSDLNNSCLSQCTSDNASASTRGFATYIREEFNDIPCRKKLAASFAVLMFVACIIAITVAGFTFDDQDFEQVGTSSIQSGKLTNSDDNGSALDIQSNELSQESLISPQEILTSTESSVSSHSSVDATSSPPPNVTSSITPEPTQVLTRSEPTSTVVSSQSSTSTVLLTQGNMADDIGNESNVAAASETSLAAPSTTLPTHEVTNETMSQASNAFESFSTVSPTILSTQKMTNKTTQAPVASETSSVVSSTVISTQGIVNETVAQMPASSESPSTVQSVSLSTQKTSDGITQAALAKPSTVTQTQATSELVHVSKSTEPDNSAVMIQATRSTVLSHVVSATQAGAMESPTTDSASGISTTEPSVNPLQKDTSEPSASPQTSRPSVSPTQKATSEPSASPQTSRPSVSPSQKTTPEPSASPQSSRPSTSLTQKATAEPSASPQTSRPSVSPTQKATPEPSALPQTSSSVQTVATPDDSHTKYLKAKSDTSIFKNRPTKSYANGLYLTVMGKNRASSFLKFDTSDVPRSFVANAVLRLHSIVPANYGDDNTDDIVASALSSVSVAMLPAAGVEWDGALVTWDDPLSSTDSFRLGSFSMEGYPYHTMFSLIGRIQRVHEVDVTRAFRRSSEGFATSTISLKLYSDVDSRGRVDFVSSDWNGGFAEPELVITLSDTPYPTEPPAILEMSSPTSSPSSECKFECDQGIIQEFKWEFGFKSIDEWINDCLQTTRHCKKEDDCEQKCKRDAEKAQKETLTKIGKHKPKCRDECIVSLAVGASTLSAPFPSTACEAECGEDTAKEFEQEFGFKSIDNWINNCLRSTEDRKKEKDPEEHCKREAETAEKKALKKVGKNKPKCRDECIVLLASTLLAPSPSSECEVECDEDTAKEFEQKFGFESIDEWISNCLRSTRDSKKEEDPEEQCKEDAEKAEKDALKKVEKKTGKCKDKCIASSAVDLSSVSKAAKRDSGPGFE